MYLYISYVCLHITKIFVFAKDPGSKSFLSYHGAATEMPRLGCFLGEKRYT